MISHFLLTTCVLLLIYCSILLAKPVKRGPPQPNTVEEGSPESLDTGLAYDHYLRQVVDVLEADPAFREKLEKANVSEIKSGNIAMHLELVNHTVRTALDELKRKEISRLQQLARLQMQAGGSHAIKNFEIPSHLNLKNPHSFEVDDLKNLIIKTTADLEELDKRRKEEFKEYEMEKEYEKQDHLSHLSEEDRKKEEARLEELKKKHANHPKVNHPGSKDQFEEVWDKVDHLEDQQFNPKTFFFKHDLNGDMEWSMDEVDAVLQLELDKMYDARNSPEEDDPIERQEEMNRMREHIFKEMDKDKNWRISFQEFITYTGAAGNQPEFEKDDGWKGIDEEEPVFTDEDYQRFVESHHAQPGVINPPHDLKFQPEHQGQQQYEPPHQGQQQFQQPPQGQQQFQQQHQGQQQFQQPPQGQQQFQQPPQGQQQYQQPPQGQQQYQQPPQGQQPSQGQQHYQQPPPGQQPPQGQQQFQQPPQGQQQFQQPPQGQQPTPQDHKQIDTQQLQKQLKELQDQLNQQQQQHQQAQNPQ